MERKDERKNDTMIKKIALTLIAVCVLAVGAICQAADIDPALIAKPSDYATVCGNDKAAKFIQEATLVPDPAKWDLIGLKKSNGAPVWIRNDTILITNKEKGKMRYNAMVYNPVKGFTRYSMLDCIMDLNNHQFCQTANYSFDKDTGVMVASSKDVELAGRGIVDNKWQGEWISTTKPNTINQKHEEYLRKYLENH